MSSISSGTTSTTGYVVSSDTTGALVLKTGSAATTAVTIDTSQNVGIGTSSPTSKLHIADNGDTALTIQSITGSGQSPSIRLQRGTYGTDGFNDVRIYNTTGVLYVDNINSANEATNLFTATPTGLGIGTSSPAYKIHVVKGSGGILSRFDSTSDGITDIYGYGLEITRSDAYIKSSGVLHLGSSHGYSTVYIDTSGRVGIGTTDTASFGRKFIVNGTGGFNSDSGTVGIGFNRGVANTYGYIGTGDWAVNGLSTADFGISSGTTGALAFGTGSGTERARITASGDLLVGKTSANYTSIGCENRSNGQINASTANLDFLNMYNNTAGTYRFFVSAAGTVHATNTTISALSDIRFKENVRDLDVGLSAIMSLKPRLYDWKEGKGANIKNARGFIAQEFETVFPDLIDTWKDPAPKGETPYKSVRQDLIPVLVKAMQEQQLLIQQLQADVAILKGVQQ